MNKEKLQFNNSGKRKYVMTILEAKAFRMNWISYLLEKIAYAKSACCWSYLVVNEQNVTVCKPEIEFFLTW